MPAQPAMRPASSGDRRRPAASTNPPSTRTAATIRRRRRKRPRSRAGEVVEDGDAVEQAYVVRGEFEPLAPIGEARRRQRQPGLVEGWIRSRGAREREPGHDQAAPEGERRRDGAPIRARGESGTRAASAATIGRRRKGATKTLVGCVRGPPGTARARQRTSATPRRGPSRRAAPDTRRDPSRTPTATDPGRSGCARWRWAGPPAPPCGSRPSSRHTAGGRRRSPPRARAGWPPPARAAAGRTMASRSRAGARRAPGRTGRSDCRWWCGALDGWLDNSQATACTPHQPSSPLTPGTASSRSRRNQMAVPSRTATIAVTMPRSCVDMAGGRNHIRSPTAGYRRDAQPSSAAMGRPPGSGDPRPSHCAIVAATSASLTAGRRAHLLRCRPRSRRADQSPASRRSLRPAAGAACAAGRPGSFAFSQT